MNIKIFVMKKTLGCSSARKLGLVNVYIFVVSNTKTFQYS